jgi:SulP family sulfate permease
MIWNTSAVSTAVMVLTFVATLLVPLQYAVLLGVAFSVVLYVFRQSNKVVVKEWVLQAQGFPLEEPAPSQVPSGRLTVLYIYGSLFFAGAKTLEDLLPKVDDADGAVVALGLRGQVEVGSTFVTVVQRYAEALRARGGKLMLVGVDPTVRDQLAKTGVLGLLGEDNVFLATPQLGQALNEAIAAATAWLGQAPAGLGLFDVSSVCSARKTSG